MDSPLKYGILAALILTILFGFTLNLILTILTSVVESNQPSWFWYFDCYDLTTHVRNNYWTPTNAENRWSGRGHNVEDPYSYGAQSSGGFKQTNLQISAMHMCYNDATTWWCDRDWWEGVFREGGQGRHPEEVPVSWNLTPCKNVGKGLFRKGKVQTQGSQGRN